MAGQEPKLLAGMKDMLADGEVWAREAVRFSTSRGFLTVCAALSSVGIAIEQIIHLPSSEYPHIRYLFGREIGNHAGDYTIGVAMQMANMFCLSVLRNSRVSERRAYQVTAALMGVGMMFIIINENYHLIGTPEPVDPLAALAAYVFTACLVDLYTLTLQRQNNRTTTFSQP